MRLTGSRPLFEPPLSSARSKLARPCSDEVTEPLASMRSWKAVRLVRVNRAGREAVLHVATVGDTMAEASLFSASYHCDAIATTDAVVRLYPKAAILAEFDRNPKAAQKFAAVLAHQVMTLRTRLEHRNIRAARDRVRHYLAINADADGRTVALSGTLKDVAGELGLTHEALYRTLADMVADGEIERRRGTIRVLKSAI